MATLEQVIIENVTSILKIIEERNLARSLLHLPHYEQDGEYRIPVMLADTSIHDLCLIEKPEKDQFRRIRNIATRLLRYRGAMVIPMPPGVNFIQLTGFMTAVRDAIRRPGVRDVTQQSAEGRH